MKNQLMTKRLRIEPMTKEELQRRVAEEPDAGRKAALKRMLPNAQSVGEAAHWRTVWRIALRKTGERVGEAWLLGAPAERTVALSYGIDEARRGQGFACEAVKALCNWAFSRGAYFVAAEAAPNNAASLRTLESCGFRCLGTGGAGERWEKEKPKPNWLAACLCLGLAVGCCLGATFGRAMPGAGVSLGMGLGFAAGVALGAALDKRDRQARQRGGAAEDGELDALFSNQVENVPQAAAAGPAKEKRLSSAARYTPANGQDAAAKTPVPDAAKDGGEKAKAQKAEGSKAAAPKKDGTKEKGTAGATPAPKAAAKAPKPKAPAKDAAAEGEPQKGGAPTKTTDTAAPKAAAKAKAPKDKADKPEKNKAAEPGPAGKAPAKAEAPPKKAVTRDEPKKAVQTKKNEPQQADKTEETQPPASDG